MSVADFDGDGIVDLLTLSRDTGSCHAPTVYWMGMSDGRVVVGECVCVCVDEEGSSLKSSFSPEGSIVLPASVKDPPLVLE